VGQTFKVMMVEDWTVTGVTRVAIGGLVAHTAISTRFLQIALC
jgi:hypothetical protein